MKSISTHKIGMFLFFISFLFNYNLVFSQQLGRNVIGTSGSENVGSGFVLYSNIGEVVSETSQSTLNMSTQGFVQPFQGITLNSNSINNIAGVSVFPNPAQNSVNVTFRNFLSANISIRIIDYKGSVVLSEKKTISDGILHCDVSDFAKGMYCILILNSDSNQIISNLKFVKS